tara:strand:+ start:516 stop:716 length:201 start_codon:yes stop_codon:yes gene_type:complete
MVHERHEDYMKRRMAEEANTTGDLYNEFSNLRLTKEVEELKERLKRVETDMAYTQKIRFVDPENVT